MTIPMATIATFGMGTIIAPRSDFSYTRCRPVVYALRIQSSPLPSSMSCPHHLAQESRRLRQAGRLVSCRADTRDTALEGISKCYEESHDENGSTNHTT